MCCELSNREISMIHLGSSSVRGIDPFALCRPSLLLVDTPLSEEQKQNQFLFTKWIAQHGASRMSPTISSVARRVPILTFARLRSPQSLCGQPAEDPGAQRRQPLVHLRP